MAETPAELTEEQKLEKEYEGDPFGLELAKSIRANEAILNGLKYDIAQRLLDAQQGGGEYPSPHDQLAVKKLEGQILNDKLFAEARRLTRRPDAV